MDALIDMSFYAVPVLLAALVSYLARNKGWLVHFVTWVLGLPLLLAFGPLMVALVGLHVFGVDLFD